MEQLFPIFYFSTFFCQFLPALRKRSFFIPLLIRVARFFLVQSMYQNGETKANDQNIPNGYKIYQMAIKCTTWL
jgi:hypothetical protein